jgi:hypothetical protein
MGSAYQKIEANEKSVSMAQEQKAKVGKAVRV